MRRSYRVCQKHGHRLEERADDTLRCPYGVGHVVTGAFRVVDDTGREHYSVTDAQEGTVVDLGGKRAADPVEPQAKKKAAGKKVLASARYSDGRHVLLLRVVHQPGLQSPFRVVWEHRPIRTSDSKRGCNGLFNTEDGARTAWRERCVETLAAGWAEAPTTNVGRGRMPTLRAIPAPALAARKRA